MQRKAKEKDEKESSKEKEEKENTHTQSRVRAREIVDNFFDAMGANPDIRPEAWNNRQVDFFNKAKSIVHKIKGLTIPRIKEWIIYIDEIGYVFKDGCPITLLNFRRSLRNFNKYFNRFQNYEAQEIAAAEKLATKEQQMKESAAKRKTPSQIADEHRKAKPVEESDWELCAEQCANCSQRAGARFCKAGCAVPPPRRERPAPPRECESFKELY